MILLVDYARDAKGFYNAIQAKKATLKFSLSATIFLLMLLIISSLSSPIVAMRVNANTSSTDAGIGFAGPWVNQITFNFMPSVDSEILALKSGSIQLMTAGLTYEESLALNGTNSIVVTAVPVFENADFNFNLHGPNYTSIPGNFYAFNNSAFRQAWNYMMGNKSWLSQIYGPFDELDNGQLGKIYGQWYYPGTLPQQNFTQANLLLNQSGFTIGSNGYRNAPNGDPINIVIQYSNAYPQQSEWVNLLSTWATQNLHIQVTGQALTPSQLVQNGFVTHHFDMQEEEGYWISPSPEYPLDIWYNANNTVSDISGFNNATFQALDAQMEFANSTTQAINDAHQLQLILQQQLPGWQMGYLDVANAYRTDAFTDWVPQPGQNVWHSWWNYLNVRQVNGQPGGNLIVGAQIEPFSLNPLSPSFEDKSCAIVCLMYDSLIRLDSPTSSLALTPDLALNWTSAPSTSYGSQQVWTFHLANNVTWSDGTRFNSSDVQYTIMAFQKYIGNGAFSRNFQYITNVTTPDSSTVNVYVKKSSIFWPYWLGISPILPKHIFASQSNPATFTNSNPVGTGPFKFVSYTPGQSLVMAKNTNYFHPAPTVSASSSTTSTAPPTNTYLYVGIAVAVTVIVVGLAVGLLMRRRRV